MYVLLLEAVLLVNNPRLPYNCVPCRSIPFAGQTRMPPACRRAKPPRMPAASRAAALLTLLGSAAAMDNGAARLPPLG